MRIWWASRLLSCFSACVWLRPRYKIYEEKLQLGVSAGLGVLSGPDLVSEGPEVLLPPTAKASVTLIPSLPLPLSRGPVTPRRGSRGVGE